ncbi:MAG: class I adenylate-forming enzyme family protein [Ruminococcus sp.]|nr:class I adenylate-forming enzyme family protein [Ruminococcus sp.]
MEEMFLSKYHRKEPIRDFDVCQTLYSLVMNINKNNMEDYYAAYLGQRLTFSQLKSDADKLAAALTQDGIKDGDIVGVCLLTVPEVAPVLLGINKIGASSYWMDASAKPTDMLAHINMHGVKTLIVFEALLPIVAGIIEYTQLERVIVVKAWFPLGKPPEEITRVLDNRFFIYKDYIESAVDTDCEPAQFVMNKPTIIVQSSGSTGQSKSIVHTDYNFNAAIKMVAHLDLPLYQKKKSLVCAPPWVIYGLVDSIYTGLVLGSETIYTTKPVEDMIYQHLGQFDYVYGVPVYYRYLYNKMLELKKQSNEESVKEFDRIKTCLDSVSVFISGGDKLSEEEAIQWQLMFDTPVVNGYGNNEVVGAAVVSPMYANRPGSIGVPGYGIIAKTFDVDTEAMLEDGEVGELCLSSTSLFKGYLDVPDETVKIKRVHNDREWVHTGDLAYINEDGFVYLKGRTRRLIIDKLGYKIAPDNIENLIQHFDFVRECVVVGTLAGENDTVPVAFVEFTKGNKNNPSLLKEIENACKSSLKEYEIPKLIKEINKIPHKENGGKQDFLALEKLAQDLYKS